MRNFISTIIVAILILSGCSESMSKTNVTSQNLSKNNYMNTQNDISEGEKRVETVFINKNVGWKSIYYFQGMFKEDTELYKTNDGGKTWREIANSMQKGSTLPDGVKSGMTFINDNIGWITSNAPWEGRIGLFKTIDSGVTWSSQMIKIPTELKESQIYTYPPLFFTDTLGVLPTRPVGDVNSLIYITSDSGETWKPFLDVNHDQYMGIEWALSEGILNAEYEGQSWNINMLNSGKWYPQT